MHHLRLRRRRHPDRGQGARPPAPARACRAGRRVMAPARRRHAPQPCARRRARSRPRSCPAAALLDAVHAAARRAIASSRSSRTSSPRTTRIARRQPPLFRRSRDLRTQPRVEPRLGQDVAARAHDRGVAGPHADRGDRRRPADVARRRPRAGDRCRGRPDQHRQGLPSRRAHGRARAGRARRPPRAACCSSRTSATSSAPRHSIWARRTRW